MIFQCFRLLPIPPKSICCRENREMRRREQKPASERYYGRRSSSLTVTLIFQSHIGYYGLANRNSERSSADVCNLHLITVFGRLSMKNIPHFRLGNICPTKAPSRAFVAKLHGYYRKRLGLVRIVGPVSFDKFLKFPANFTAGLIY